MLLFGLVTAKDVLIYEQADEASQVVDEIFSGWAVGFYPQEICGGFLRIVTHYGYCGYIRKNVVQQISEVALRKRQDKDRFFRINRNEADLLCEARVQGRILDTLPKNAVVELLADCGNGWCRVAAADGTRGYMHRVFLSKRLDDDRMLFGASAMEQSGLQTAWEQEAWFRDSVVRHAAAYLGAQYRWGGKKGTSIDCSGLAFMSYLESGVLIYRDAVIKEGYPVHAVAAEECKPADLLFFPGHVAVYLGRDRYIHATANEKVAGVTVNSLLPEDADYRKDLAETIIAYGSVF